MTQLLTSALANLNSDDLIATLLAHQKQKPLSTLIEQPIELPIELVVFSDLVVEQLLHLADYCQLSLVKLNRIYSTHKHTSYHFSVQCKQLDNAVAKLALFSQQHQLEAALLKEAPRLKEIGLLVMDMDSTVIQIECIDEIAALAGVGQQVAEVTELAMQGKLDFAQSLHQRVAKLAGAPESILAEVANNLPLMSGLKTLIAELKQQGWRIAIASGGFTYFAEYLKKQLNLDDVFANQLEIIDGKLTGKVLGNVIDAQAKAETIALLQKKYQIDQQQTVAIGDGANDLLMMKQAQLGVAFHAKPIVLAQASACIHQAGLDCLLHWLK